MDFRSDNISSANYYIYVECAVTPAEELFLNRFILDSIQTGSR